MATVTLTPPVYPRKSQRIALRNSSEKESIVEQSHAIATYYIPYHLRSKLPQESLRGLPKHYLVPPQHPSELFTFIANLCTQMEQDNYNFFNGLPERVGLKAENAKSLFFNVSKETFSDKVINWGRVVSIYTLAATFAIFFAKNGQLSVVQKIPQWIREFVDQELADWIKDQRGWDELLNKLSDNNGIGAWPRMLAFGGVFVAAGYILLSTTR